MSTLGTLKLVAAKKPVQMSVVQIRRNKLMKRLGEQIELAKAQLANAAYTPTRMRSYVDSESGLRKQVAVPKRVKPWYFAAENGKVCVAVRYGAKVLELAKGKQAVEVGTMKELVSVLEVLCAAVAAGELDAAIEAASAQVRSGFAK